MSDNNPYNWDTKFMRKMKEPDKILGGGPNGLFIIMVVLLIWLGYQYGPEIAQGVISRDHYSGRGSGPSNCYYDERGWRRCR